VVEDSVSTFVHYLLLDKGQIVISVGQGLIEAIINLNEITGTLRRNREDDLGPFSQTGVNLAAVLFEFLLGRGSCLKKGKWKQKNLLIL
jgi:hypothetical protein